MNNVKKELEAFKTTGNIYSVLGDLSVLKNVEVLANNILEKFTNIDVLINNAGIYKTQDERTVDGFDIRFSVNTLAPYLLTKKLLSVLSKNARVINLSSAAQAPVHLNALIGSDILVRAALSDEFKDASGKYYDNDIASFSKPHLDALNIQKCNELVFVMEDILENYL